MADEKVMRQARKVFKTLCETFEAHDWSYDKDEENMIIKSGATGKDIPINLRIRINPDLQIISLYSHLPFSVPENDRVLMAVAANIANCYIVDGSFDLSLANGTLLFRMTSSFRESLLSKEMFEYMFFISCLTVDHYNDKLEMVVKHEMSIEEFINFVKE